MEKIRRPQGPLNRSGLECLPSLLVQLTRPNVCGTSKIPVHSAVLVHNSGTTRAFERRHHLPKTALGVKGDEQRRMTVVVVVAVQGCAKVPIFGCWEQGYRGSGYGACK